MNSSAFPGAIALMSVINKDIRGLGWYFLPVILLSTSFVLVLALILNNIQRRYPVFWFRPDDDDAYNDQEKHIDDTRSIHDSIASSGQRTIVPYASESDGQDTHSITHSIPDSVQSTIALITGKDASPAKDISDMV
jgi:hypothetical protein